MLIDPEIIVGHLYEDLWCTPYMRANFNLQAGRHALKIRVWNPKNPAFLNNRIDIRRGLTLLHSTGALELEGTGSVFTEINIPTDNYQLSISLRSTISWYPPAPDTRFLGFILLSWECRSLE